MICNRNMVPEKKLILAVRVKCYRKIIKTRLVLFLKDEERIPFSRTKRRTRLR